MKSIKNALMIGLAPVLVLFSQSGTNAQEIAQSVVQSDDSPFNALVGRKRVRRQTTSNRRYQIDRYVLAADDRTLLFEARANEARVQFLCSDDDRRLDCLLDTELPSPEIIQLTATRGPRGDVIYKNSHGDTLLRIASYGGATVFWPGSFEGSAASKSFGDDPPLKLPSADIEVVSRRAKAATAYISAKTGAPIVFNVDVARSNGAGDFGVLADAVLRTAAGIGSVAKDPTGAAIISNRISQVQFVGRESPAVELSGDALVVGYSPTDDLDGRPSSATVSRYLEETL
ncbi:MAG: DUF4908 domain-containing protein [Marinicaulis sp.]|nr:DUF4908 domain-containing protein [Marinicaulis sp.]